MSHSTVLSTLVATAFVLLVSSEASAALSLTAGDNNIDAKADDYSPGWLGTGPANPLKGLPSCSSAGPCQGWYKPYTGGPKIYSWDDSGTVRTHIVHGNILARYDSLSNASGLLGFPITDELDAAGGTGRYNDFANSGSIYYKWGAAAAYEVHGWIRRKWNALGKTASVLGYPTANEANWAHITNGRYSAFEHGYIIYDGTAGSWQDDTWPLMTHETPAPVVSSGPWITARSKGADGSHYLVGCGFTANSTVLLYQNSRDARHSLPSTTANARGCFGFDVEYWPGPISSARAYNNIVTYEARSSGSSSFAAVGVPYSRSQLECYHAAPGKTWSYHMVHKTDRFTWCVSYDSWTLRHAEIVDYFSFPDEVLGQLETYFTVPYSAGMQVVQVDEVPGFGTPTEFGPGYRMGGDAFAIGSQWAYIGSVQEIVNSYTANIAGGWPRDWWANHKNPFPIYVNWNILYDLGKHDAYEFQYALQHGPGPNGNTGPDADPWYVVSPDFQQWDPQEMLFRYLRAFGGGWDVYGRAFQHLKDDGILLDVAAPAEFNVSKLRSEYVTAYLSLAYGDDLTAFVTQHRVGQRPTVYHEGVAADCWLWDDDGNDTFGCTTVNFTAPNGKNVTVWNRTWDDYTVSSAVVTKIADAHCRIAAAANEGASVSAARTKLRTGDPAGAIVALGSAGGCGDLPPECGCYSTKAAAPWH